MASDKPSLTKSEKRDDFFINPAGTILIAVIGAVTATAAGGPVFAMMAGFIMALKGFQSAQLDIPKMVLEQHRKDELPKNHPVSVIATRLAKEAGLKNPPRCIEFRSKNGEMDGIPYAGTMGTPDSSVIIVSPGIENKMTPSELDAVIAHEICHIKHSDTKLAVLQGGLSQISMVSLLYVAITSLIALASPQAAAALTPTLGAIIAGYAGVGATLLTQAAISRARERRADREGSMLSNNPWALSSALGRMVELQVGALKMMNKPKPGKFRKMLIRMFRSHPKTAWRKEALENLGEQMIAQDPSLARIKALTISQSKAFEAGQSLHTPQKRGPWDNASDVNDYDDDTHNIMGFYERPLSDKKLPFNKEASEQDNTPSAVNENDITVERNLTHKGPHL